MCDKNNPQDKKILLLAELVESKCEALGKTQEELKGSLNSTNQKLDKLTELLEKYESDTHGCPVYKNRQDYEKLSFFVKYPKTASLALLGILAMSGGFFGANFINFVKEVISHL